MTQVTKCPACGETTFLPFLNCIDYTVSHETFSIVSCAKCKFTFTNPYPDLSKLGDYYKSTSYVSHSAKPANAIDHFYVLARTQTLKWKTNLVKRYSKESSTTLLDYGCGTGDFLAAAKQKGWNVTGVEPSTAANKIAEGKTTQSIYTSLDQISNSTFDTITLWHVLEHVPDLHKLLESLRARLTQNGTIFIAVPNRNSWDAKHYGATWAAYDVPRHLWHFRQIDMQKIVGAHSLNVANILPMKLDAYYVSLLSEKYRHKTLNAITVLRSITNGIKSNISARSSKEYSSLIYVITK